MGSAEAYLPITRPMGWDLNVSQDWLTAAMARLVPDRGEEFLAISACRLTCGYDTENPC
jgi:hypothetical protein